MKTKRIQGPGPHTHYHNVVHTLTMTVTDPDGKVSTYNEHTCTASCPACAAGYEVNHIDAMVIIGGLCEEASETHRHFVTGEPEYAPILHFPRTHTSTDDIPF